MARWAARAAVYCIGDRLRGRRAENPHQPAPFTSYRTTAHASAVENGRNETRFPLKVRQECANLGSGKNDGKAPRARGPHDVFEPWQRIAEHMTIEKPQCAQRLRLRGRAHVSCHGQVRQKGFDLDRSHCCRIFLAVMQDGTANPADTGLLGSSIDAPAVMTRADRFWTRSRNFGGSAIPSEASSETGCCQHRRLRVETRKQGEGQYSHLWCLSTFTEGITCDPSTERKKRGH